jgi:hypothetical protein
MIIKVKWLRTEITMYMPGVHINYTIKWEQPDNFTYQNQQLTFNLTQEFARINCTARSNNINGTAADNFYFDDILLGIPRRRAPRNYSTLNKQLQANQSPKNQMKWEILFWNISTANPKDTTTYTPDDHPLPVLTSSDNLSVLMIIADSVSRFTAENVMPKTLQYMQQHLGAVNMKHHNVLGWHSMINADSFLGGY